MNNQYEVLSPWADADPIPLRGISTRVTNFEDKKIGLFCNSKIAARPIQDVVEKKLKERFPTLNFVRFLREHNTKVAGTEDKAGFEEWVKGVDAVIAAVGD